MDYKLGSIAHIEIAGGNIAKSKAFYSKLFGWTFNPMSDTYEFFDCGNATGAMDADMKPGHHGTVLVLACTDVAAKLKEVEKAGGKLLKPKTEIGGGHGWYGYFEDLAGNKLGVWQPAPR